jgi:seryl-tRNA synthetase
MFDLKMIRDNPADFDKAMKRRALDAQSPAILKLDEQRRAVQTELQTLQQERNEKSKEIGEIKKSGGDAQAAMDAVGALKDKMGVLEEKERALGEELKTLLSGIPNILFDDVPDGEDENDNKEVHQWGEPRVAKGDAKEHYEIGEALGMMDFETAAKLSGSRFTLLSGPLARLERAIAQFMLDTQTEENGYTECSPPLMVRDQTMYGTGQLPKFGEDLFKTTRGDWLIPTAEVPLTNIVAEEIVDADYLPRRYTAFTPCFRSEAGSAGKDTRGMLRQHQFYKVELVSVTHPEKSVEEHERMLKCAEGILEKLNLPYRTVVLCSGDTGFGAKKTYDIEVWLPGQDTYREISSCSNCGDFQARRMNARFKTKGDKHTQFVHTLNGSGLAVGRTLIAIMENYYDPADGGIHIPDVLKPYMGGIKKIVKESDAAKTKAA